jgi:hypothetical protein
VQISSSAYSAVKLVRLKRLGLDHHEFAQAAAINELDDAADLGE